MGWREDPEPVRAYSRASWIWVGLFSLRLAVQLPLYLASALTALGVARVAMGIPLFAVGIWLSWLILRPTLHAGRAGPGRAREFLAAQSGQELALASSYGRSPPRPTFTGSTCPRSPCRGRCSSRALTARPWRVVLVGGPVVLGLALEGLIGLAIDGLAEVLELLVLVRHGLGRLPDGATAYP